MATDSAGNGVTLCDFLVQFYDKLGGKDSGFLLDNDGKTVAKIVQTEFRYSGGTSDRLFPDGERSSERRAG